MGLLARLAMLYATGHEQTKALADQALKTLDLPLIAIFFHARPHGRARDRIEGVRRPDAGLASTS